jgi:hypothetical protein
MKATEIQICIFTWLRTDGQNGVTFSGYEDWPEPEKSIGFAVSEAVARVQFDKGEIPINYWGLCSLSDAEVGVENQNVVVSNGINPNKLPAIQMYAKYPNGKIGSYILGKSLVDDIFSPITTEAIEERIRGLLYYKEPSNSQGIICKFIPAACKVPGWLWLGALAYSAYKTYDTENYQKALWLAATGVAATEVSSRGGIKQLLDQ